MKTIVKYMWHGMAITAVIGMQVFGLHLLFHDRILEGCALIATALMLGKEGRESP